MFGIDKDKIKAAFADYQRAECQLPAPADPPDISLLAQQAHEIALLKCEVLNLKQFIKELGGAIS